MTDFNQKPEGEEQELRTFQELLSLLLELSAQSRRVGELVRVLRDLLVAEVRWTLPFPGCTPPSGSGSRSVS